MSKQMIIILVIQAIYQDMRNPWVHDDEEVDVSTEAEYQSNIRWIGVFVWFSLAVLLAAIVLTASDQLAFPSPNQLVSILLTAFGGFLFLIFLVPVLFRLLQISRLLTALVVLGSVGLGGRFLITDGYLFAAAYQSLVESITSGFHEAIELFEIVSIFI